MTTLLRFQHVALPLRGGEEARAMARAFYSGTLGLRELAVPAAIAEHVLWFAVGDQELHLFAGDTGVAANGLSRRHPCFQVDDLATMKGQLRERGVEIIEADADIPGRERFFVRDPFGNALEFTTMDAA